MYEKLQPHVWEAATSCADRAAARTASQGAAAVASLRRYGRRGRCCARHTVVLVAQPPQPPALTHLDLGGLARLSDEALFKLAARAPHLASLDLRGCTRLSASGLTTAIAAAAC